LFNTLEMAWGNFQKKIVSMLPRTFNSILTSPQIISKNKILKHLPGMDAVNTFYDKVWTPEVQKMNDQMGLTGTEYEIKGR